MQRYGGWSQQDARYVSKMNYLRNQAALGGEFQGTRAQVEQYLGYVENAIAHSADIYENSDRSNRQTRSNQPFHESKQFKSFLASRYSFPIFWLLATFFGFLLGILISGSSDSPSSSNNDRVTLAAAIEVCIMFLSIGAGIGFLQSLWDGIS